MSSNLTKQAIMQSFLRLLNQRPLDKITVRDIVEDCDLNRNTFYYHYQDVYALLREIFETEVSRVLRDNPLQEGTWQEGFIMATRFASENKRAVYHLYNSAQRDVLEGYLLRVTDKMMSAFVSRQAGDLDVAEEDLRHIVVFFKYAVLGIVYEWFQRDMRDEPERVIRRMGEIFDGAVRAALEQAARTREG